MVFLPEMADRQGERRSERCSPGRFLVVLALLPALLAVPALGGFAAWIHAHGPSGAHVHLMSSGHDHDVAALEGWHDAQHRLEPADEDHDVGGRAPKGLRIELPEIVAPATHGSNAIHAAGVRAPVPPPFAGWHPPLVERSLRPWLIRSGWPPQGTRRTGVAALLRSSHAIRI